MEFAVPKKGKRQPLKPRQSLALLSIAPAQAQSKPIANADLNKCSTTTYPANSAVQCWKPTAASYVECVKILTDKGWRASDTWWTCTNQKFKI
jgi:hypothetical protein